jgi:hypothetical protein
LRDSLLDIFDSFVHSMNGDRDSEIAVVITDSVTVVCEIRNTWRDISSEHLCSGLGFANEWGSV